MTMRSNKGIFWLASYPKSGNTWFRIVLSNLLHPITGPDDINHIRLGSIASCRNWINDALGFDSRLLSDAELDQLRPNIYTWYAKQSQCITYHKIHDAYTYIQGKTPLIPNEGTLGALYFIRNPLDVAVSFAHHSNCTVDNIIEIMGRKEMAVPIAKNQQKQVRQHLLSWSKHVQSWAIESEINVLVLRYEDMLLNPWETFTKGIGFLKLAHSQSEIEQAIERASFKNLQQQESLFGFKEKALHEGRFFRKGIAGDWENALTGKQIQKLIDDHREMMLAYGYLDANDQPIRHSIKEQD